MSEIKELKQLLVLFENGILTEDHLAEFIWQEYERSAKPFEKLDKLEKFGIMMSSSLLSVVYSVKMRSFQPIKGLQFNLEKDILKKKEVERIYDLAQIRRLLDDCVSQATLIRHLELGKIKGKRLSTRKTEIKESEVLKYVASQFPQRLESVKEKMYQET